MPLVALVLAASLPAPQELAPGAEARLEAVARAAIAESDLPGLSLRVEVGGDVLLSRGWGHFDASRRIVEDPRLARDAEGALELLVALALLERIDAGELEASSALSQHFPRLELGGARIELTQLLSHTSGLPSCLEAAAAEGAPFDGGAALAWLAQRPLDFAPGACFEYSESNALLAALVLERVADAALPEALEPLLERAGMESTGFVPDSAARRRTVDLPGERRAVRSVAEVLALGGLRSNLADLTKLVRALGERELAGEAAWRTLSEPVQVQGGEARFAFGFARAKLAGYRRWSFGGGGAGSSLHVAWYPELDLVVALASGEESADLPAVEQRLARALLDLPEPGVVDLALTPEQRELYAGGYYVGCTRIAIEARGERLFFSWPYEEPFRLRYQGQQRFVSADDAEVTLEFELDDGRASRFVLTHHGSQSVATRVE
jgi:CubicO group peptidase (beta-lactamase class C family)